MVAAGSAIPVSGAASSQKSCVMVKVGSTSRSSTVTGLLAAAAVHKSKPGKVTSIAIALPSAGAEVGAIITLPQSASK